MLALVLLVFLFLKKKSFAINEELKAQTVDLSVSRLKMIENNKKEQANQVPKRVAFRDLIKNPTFVLGLLALIPTYFTLIGLQVSIIKVSLLF